MKKFLAIFLALVLTMALLAGCAAKQATEAGQTAKTAETVKIVLLLPGEVNDQGWNASNYAGVVACNEKLGTKMEYVEAVQEADFESTFREYAERGYDIIMAAGSQFDEAASSVAANYPNTLFMVVNGAKCDKANLCPLFPKEYEASYHRNRKICYDRRRPQSGHAGSDGGVRQNCRFHRQGARHCRRLVQSRVCQQLV